MCAQLQFSIRTFLFVLHFLCTSATKVIATATRTPAWLKVYQLCGNPARNGIGAWGLHGGWWGWKMYHHLKRLTAVSSCSQVFYIHFQCAVSDQTLEVRSMSKLSKVFLWKKSSFLQQEHFIQSMYHKNWVMDWAWNPCSFYTWMARCWLPWSC